MILKSFSHSLRPHVMALSREKEPFNICTTKADLLTLRHKDFARVAGLVVSKPRPGTAKGTMFMTIEDDTGDSNVVLWAST